MICCLLLFVQAFVAWPLHSYNPEANPTSTITAGSARFTVLTSNLIRLEYDAGKQFEDRATIAIVNRHLSTPAFNSSVNSTHLIIETSVLTLIHALNKPFSPTTLSISGNIPTNNNNGATKFTYRPSGYGVDTDNSWSANLFGTVRSLDLISSPLSLNCSELGNTTVHNESFHCAWAPFGRQGFALFDDTDGTTFEDDWIADDFANANQQDWYFFGHGLNFKAALADLISISGQQPLPPRYMLGSMHCRWYDYSDLSLRQVVLDYERHGIPLDVLVIDMDWHLYGPWGSYTYNTDLLPLYNLTQQWLHRKRLHTSANLHDANGIAPSEQYYKNAARALNWTDMNATIPFNVTSRAYVSALQENIVGPIFSATQQTLDNTSGFDFWWIDWQQGGTTGVYHSNINPTILLNHIRGTQRARSQQRSRDVILSRFGGLGSQRYPYGFSGDISHSWVTLPYLIYFTATASNVAFTWSHDILGAANDSELNTRYIQFGAFSPLFRLHDLGESSGSCVDTRVGCAQLEITQHPRRNRGFETAALLRRAQLLPYLYNATRFTSLSGVQVVRPLYYEYSDERAFESVAFEYMLGGAMVVAPVVRKSGDGGLFTLANVNVWLSGKDEWYSVHSGWWIEQGMDAMRAMDLSEMAVFVRANEVVATRLVGGKDGVLGRASDVMYDGLRWEMYLNGKAVSGESVLYEDDGWSMDYVADGMHASVETVVAWEWMTNTEVLRVKVDSLGGYQGFNASRMQSVKVFNVLTPLAVYCNGIAVGYSKFGLFDDAEGVAGEGGFWYNGMDMALVVNCARVLDSESAVMVEMHWQDGMEEQTQLVNGMRGRVNRAVLCKQSLDERNVAYGVSRAMLTKAAGYSTYLGYIGDDYDAFKSYVQGFGVVYDSARDEVDALDEQSVGKQRLQYCKALLSTIYL